MTASPTADDIARVFRDESGRCLATLVRILGDIDLAEDAVQEAFVDAARTWPDRGLPPNPGAWITTTARNRAIDRLRRESSRDQRETEATTMTASHDESLDVGPLPDDQLRLIFTCCHPALAPEAHIALTLRLIGGLQTPEIAAAFLVPEATMAQRIVRAKRKIKANNVPYRVPEGPELAVRLRSVLAVVYLIFTEGHRASSGDELVRTDLCDEAIRLSRLLCDLMPEEPEAVGLLALLLLTDARRDTREVDGVLVALPEQDRSQWNQDEITEGHELVRRCLRRNQPGPYQIQAAIAAVHTDAPTADRTDWVQVLALYDQLIPFAPTPVVQLNRAVAVAEVRGAAEALAEVDILDLEGYLPYQATRADLLRRVGRSAEAVEAYDAAVGSRPARPSRRS